MKDVRLRFASAVLLLPLFLACGQKEEGGAQGSIPGAPSTSGGVPKGPHGGRLLSEGDFQVEVTIFERGVPPEFRVYAYASNKPIELAEVKVVIDVHRLGGRVDTIGFKHEAGYLRGDKVVYEPHSFEAKVSAEWRGKTYRLGYSQVEARTQMDAEAVKTSGIELEEAGPAKMKSILELPGEIALNPDRVARLVPRFEGVITDVRKNLGDKVSQGEIVAVLDSQVLADSKLEYIQALHRLKFSQVSFEREEQLWKKKVTPEEDFISRRHALDLAAATARGAEQKLKALGLLAADVKALIDHPDTNLARYELRAPQEGVVIEKAISLGQAVKADTDLFTIADLGTVLAKVTVYGKDLKFAKVDQEVSVKSEDLGIEAVGRVAYLGPLIGKETRAAKAHVRIPNSKGLWRPGLFVTVHLVQEEFTAPVAVRVEALQRLRDWDVVFLQDGNQFEACVLELGRRTEEWVEVLDGLPAGTKYVSKNSFLIKADILKSGATHDH